MPLAGGEKSCAVKEARLLTRTRPMVLMVENKPPHQSTSGFAGSRTNQPIHACTAAVLESVDAILTFVITVNVAKSTSRSRPKAQPTSTESRSGSEKSE